MMEIFSKTLGTLEIKIHHNTADLKHKSSSSYLESVNPILYGNKFWTIPPYKYRQVSN